MDGIVVIVTGGYNALVEWYQNNKVYSPFKHTDGTTYHIYGNGVVTFANGTVVLEQGGYPELIKLLYPQVVTTTTTHYFNGNKIICVNKSGRCYYSKNNVTITENGGVDFVKEYFNYVTYNVNGTHYRVYNNGSAFKEDERDIYCKDAPKCLYYTNYIYGNTTYVVYQNGTVTDVNHVVICETGGVDCLKIEL